MRRNKSGMSEKKRFCCDFFCNQGKDCPLRGVRPAKNTNNKYIFPPEIKPDRFLGPFTLIACSALIIFLVGYLLYLVLVETLSIEGKNLNFFNN